jgi:putative DNA primase/helicase
MRAATQIINELNSYTELTPSGTGLRVILKGTLPANGRKRGNVEMYEKGRFLTITGQRIDGFPDTIEDRQAELNRVHQHVFEKKAKKTREHRAPSGVRDKLLRGDWEAAGYSSQSEGDLALCNRLALEHDGDAGAVDAAFRKSGLMRAKWDDPHYADGRTYGEETVRKAIEWSSTITTSTSADHDDLHPNDAGKRLADRYGDDAKYCNGQYYVYDGKVWSNDDSFKVQAFALEIIESYRTEATELDDAAEAMEAEANQAEDLDGVAELSKKAADLRSRADKRWSFYHQLSRPNGVAQILEAASWRLSIDRDQLDRDPYLLNAQNGTIDLRTGKLRPHQRADLITKIAPVAYDPDARSEKWEGFLADAFHDNDDSRTFIQRYLGAAVIGEANDDAVLFLLGAGGSGKTTLLESARRAIGDYGHAVDFSIFLEKKQTGGVTPELDALPGVRLVTSTEPPEGKRFEPGKIKALTGGDMVTVNPKYRPVYEFTPVFSVALAANKMPKAPSDDSGFWRRWFVVRMDNVPAKPDKALRRILAPAPKAHVDRFHQTAVLAWMVQGCLDYRRVGLSPPQSVLAATACERSLSTPLAPFLRLRTRRDAGAFTRSAGLQGAYAEYCEAKGLRPVDDATWGRSLEDWGLTNERRDGHRGWVGIRLLDAGGDAGGR